jgi:uncharacterized protein (TIGR02145 family)
MRYLLTSLLCVFTLSLTAQEACPNVFDYDNDGNIAINDFIAMLSYFGDTDSDSDGVFDSEDDCIDVTACNYQSNPTEPCDALDAIGVCGGNCLDDDDGDGVCDSALFINCGDQVAHGYNYTTVQIGEQCWFAENCRYLPEVSPPSISSTTYPYYYVYGYEGTDLEAAKATEYYTTDGVLYNWPAVMTAGICPSGWHIPSDGEWQTMEISLGMSEAEAAQNGLRGTDEGYQMKSTSGWNDYNGSSGNGSNSSGFNGLPGGMSGFNDFQGSYGYSGSWWSTSEDVGHDGNSFCRKADHDDTRLMRNDVPTYFGFSARCLQD